MKREGWKTMVKIEKHGKKERKWGGRYTINGKKQIKFSLKRYTCPGSCSHVQFTCHVSLSCTVAQSDKHLSVCTSLHTWANTGHFAVQSIFDWITETCAIFGMMSSPGHLPRCRRHVSRSFPFLPLLSLLSLLFLHYSFFAQFSFPFSTSLLLSLLQ